MAEVILDGVWDIATPISAPLFSPAFEGDNTSYLMEQVFEQTRSGFSRLALNTAHPDYSDFVLVTEGELTTIGTQLVRWTRTYAKVPDTRSEPGGTFAYTFPGFWGAWQTFGTEVIYEYSGRPPMTLSVVSRIQFDYYLVGTGGSYSSFTDIPVIAPFRPHLIGNPSLLVEYLFDSPPFVTGSDPSRTAYDAYVSSQTELAVEGSVLNRWRGNIFERQSRYVVAQ